MKTSKLSLSVVICTRNRHDLLLNCLESLLKGTVLPKEVIVVDTSECTPSEIHYQRLFQKRRTRFIYRKAPHVNLAHSRNLGMSLAKCNILAFIDDDAIAAADWVFNILQTFKKFPKCVGIGGSAESLEENYWSKAAVEIYYKGLGIKDFRKPIQVDGFAGLNFSFRKSFLDLHELRFNETYKTGEDIVFCYEIKRLGGILLYVPSVKVKHKFRTSLLSFFKRYYEYALDEYRYWNEYPIYSGCGWYLPTRMLEWVLFPLFLLKRFIKNVYYFSFKKRLFDNYPLAVIVYQIACFLGTYRQFIFYSLKKYKGKFFT